MVKPFKLSNLKKVSRHEVELIRALYEFLPKTDARDQINLLIRRTLMKHLGQDIRYYMSSVEKKKFNEYAASLSECPVLVVLGLTPINKKIIVEIDYQMANLIINKLLGGGSGTIGELKPLTETEQGVLQYLIMQILQKIHSLAGAEPRVHFRFEKFVFDPREVTKIVGSREGMCILTMNVSLFDQSGFVKLVFPYPFLEEILNLPYGAGSSRGEREYFGSRLKKWGFIRTSIWAEAGSSLLSPVEMKDLEAGDVVLFDDTRLKLHGKNPDGEVLLHFGKGGGCVISKLVKSDSKTIKCEINDITKQQ